ncbi:class F sortase [Gordonia humi]|uniref:class F sortase n=1 Tax=Gordonia humi TaxID=686429 RepID=UPI00361CCC79
MSRLRRVLIAAAAAALLAASACGSQDATSAPSGAQSGLPTPVTAVSHDASAPQRLVIDGASAPIEPVATDARGTLLPPTDVAKLGWWVDSALPGSGAGTIVIAGHVDDADQGVGYAAEFAHLATGAPSRSRPLTVTICRTASPESSTRRRRAPAPTPCRSANSTGSTDRRRSHW